MVNGSSSSLNGKRGFTLVELLCVIVILGIISVASIAGVSKLISKSKEEKTNQNERTVSMAASSYLQSNKSILPKSIGQVERISVKDLYDAKYITSEIENSSGENCMKESYVRIYKYSNTGYTYTPYIFCGDEVPPEKEVVPKPSGSAKFVEKNGDEYKDADFNKIKNAMVLFSFDGGKNSDDKPLAIESYNYSVSVQINTDDNLREIYNSGTLSANNESHIESEIALKDYVNISNVSTFYVKYSVRNIAGGFFESTATLGEKQASYQDKIPPTCDNITNEAPDENTWYNLKTQNKSRVVSIDCKDGAGESGCVRGRYSKTWPNSDEPSAEYSWITVKDNAGNKNVETCSHGSAGCCLVRVNVDSITPTIKVLNAYKSDANGKPTGSNILSSSLTADKETDGIFNILSNGYKSGSTTNGWFNGKDYPYGVVYEVQLSDDLKLAGYTWKTNKPNTGTEKSTDITSAGAGPEGLLNEKAFISTNGNSSQKVYIRFTEDGFRYGVLRAYDKAGNSTSVGIYANLDKVAPPAPNPTSSNDLALVKIDGTTVIGSYTLKTWSKDFIRGTYNVTSLRRDNVTGIEMSGFDKFVTTIKKGDGNSYTANTETFDVKGGKDDKSFDGVNTAVVISCDRAGNCTKPSAPAEMWIDRTAPTCKTTGGSTKWIGINSPDPVIKGTCNDAGGARASGCAQAEISYTFKVAVGKNLVTSTAGPGPNGGKGVVKDKAGNTADCAANQTLKIDHTRPKCKVSDNDQWTKKDRTVYYKCADESKGSGCPDPSSNDNKPGSGGYQKKWTESKKKVKVAKFTINDNAGNTTECSAKTLDVYVDKSAPTYSSGGSISGNTVKAAKFSDKFTDREIGSAENDYKVAGAGVEKVQYCYVGDGENCSWKKDRRTGPNSSCDKKVKVYARGVDELGNTSTNGKYLGSYRTSNCCNDTNWGQCPWYTACRRGITSTYNDPGATSWMGTVCHQSVPSSFWGGGGSCSGSTYLYVTEKGGKRWKIHYTGGQGGSRVSPSSGHASGYIYSNCVDKSRANAICQYSDCPG